MNGLMVSGRALVCVCLQVNGLMVSGKALVGGCLLLKTHPFHSRRLKWGSLKQWLIQLSAELPLMVGLGWPSGLGYPAIRTLVLDLSMAGEQQRQHLAGRKAGSVFLHCCCASREKLQERLAKLSGGVAVLKIGGGSEIEVSCALLSSVLDKHQPPFSLLNELLGF